MISLPTLAELNLLPTLPATIVAVGMCLLLLIDLWIPEGQKNRTAWLGQGILATAFLVNMFMFNQNSEALFGMFIADGATAFMNMVILIATFISILLSMDYLKRTGTERGEFYSLILFSASGAMFMASANDLVIIFVALELLSIPLYVMAAFRYTKEGEKDEQLNLMGRLSEESGLKYFILGAFASSFLVYGSALIYGGTGSTNLTQIVGVVEQIQSGVAPEAASPLLILFGAGLVLVGLGFKVAVFPFHMWTPDVYQGAPTNVTAYMSVAAKIGGFAALARVMASALPALVIGGAESAAWQMAVAVVAGLTMVLGNFVAITQTNMKRMLAYSSIAHGGYMLMAVAAAGSGVISETVLVALSVYLLAYTFTNLGAFAVTMAIEKDNGTGTEIEDFVGLSKSQPMMAALMTVFMMSLIGIPATGGFIGKYFVFAAAMEAQLYTLAVIGVLSSVASAYYYMRPVINMYLRNDESDGDPAAGATPALRWALYMSAAGTLLVGLAPGLATNLIDGMMAILRLPVF